MIDFCEYLHKHAELREKISFTEGQGTCYIPMV